MTAVDYDPFIERMINRYEGGYGWDSGDPGGPTKYGITCFDLAEHRHQRMTSMAAWASIVRAMPLSEAEDIYKTKYATQCCFDQLHAGCDCVVLDFGVNSGSSRSIKYAQSVVGVAVDGILGPETLAAINNHSPTSFITGLCAARLRFLKGLRTWGTFGRGWGARVLDLRQYSLNLLSQHGMVAGRLEVLKPTKRGHSKEMRIPRAFGKSYGDEELQELLRQHERKGEPPQ